MLGGIVSQTSRTYAEWCDPLVSGTDGSPSTSPLAVSSVAATDGAPEDSSDESWVGADDSSSASLIEGTEGVDGGSGIEFRGDITMEGRLGDFTLSPSRIESAVIDSLRDKQDVPSLQRAKTWLTI